MTPPLWQKAKRNTGLEEAQAGVKIAGRNINNLQYADDITLKAKSEEELKSFLMKVKEESEKVGLRLNIQKMKIMASGPITSWQIDGETVETVSDFTFGGSKITADGDFSHKESNTTEWLNWTELKGPYDRDEGILQSSVADSCLKEIIVQFQFLKKKKNKGEKKAYSWIRHWEKTFTMI